MELNSPLTLKWKRGKDLPFVMTHHLQAVVIGDNVYVGGGNTNITEDKGTVMVYSLDTGSWRTLPPYESEWFGMAAVNNQLVLVGGIVISNQKVTSLLGMWDEGPCTWTHPYPEMPTSRCVPCVISHQKWLIVAGGEDEVSPSPKVELLDTLSGQWYKGSPLPKGCSAMSSAINGNMWYLSRGFSSQRLNCVCLDELISQAVPLSANTTSPSTPSPWQTLTDAPLTRFALLVFNGALLMVGGLYTSAIHLYQPSSRSWVRVGNIPTKRWQCTCVVLPSGEIFVVGGETYSHEDNKNVDIGIITF